MLKKTITYKNLDGATKSEEHYFHLRQADVAKMELSHMNGGSGGLAEHLRKIAAKESGKDIIEAFEDIIAKSYGFKTEDGEFDRDPEKTRRFMNSEAYSVLFMELVTDGVAGAKFVNGIMPTELQQSEETVVKAVEDGPVEPTLSIREMDDEQLEAHLRSKGKPKDWSREELVEAMRRGIKV